MDGLPDPRPVPLQVLLLWDGACGQARFRGVSVELDQAPQLSTVRLLRAIRFAPQLHAAELRESGQATRAMTPKEIAEALALLEGMASDAKARISRPGDLT